MTDGPADYSKNLDVCPEQLRAAFLASEKWLKKIRQLRNRGEFSDQQIEHARLAFEVYRKQVASYGQ